MSAKGKQESRFDIDSVRKSVLITSHNIFRDSHVHIFFSDNLSRNSCISSFRVSSRSDFDDCDVKVHFQVSKQLDFRWVHYRVLFIKG